MFPVPEQSYLSTCPVCQNQIDVTSLDPFTKLKCPFCGQMVRVRRKFDHFMIVRQIGEGGMSRVFEAEDETLGRRVALKILNQRYSRDATRVEQFRQEALITANVNHPNVIKLYSVGYDQGYFYIAMELVTGGSLEQRIRKEGRLKESEALRIGLEVAEGLRAAQQMGLIHRDVKPANILLPKPEPPRSWISAWPCLWTVGEITLAKYGPPPTTSRPRRCSTTVRIIGATSSALAPPCTMP